MRLLAPSFAFCKETKNRLLFLHDQSILARSFARTTSPCCDSEGPRRITHRWLSSLGTRDSNNVGFFCYCRQSGTSKIRNVCVHNIIDRPSLKYERRAQKTSLHGNEVLVLYRHSQNCSYMTTVPKAKFVENRIEVALRQKIIPGLKVFHTFK